MDIQSHADFGAIIPSFLDDYPLDPFEFRLFARIQRRSARRECFESLPNMAKGCHMSLGKTRTALRVLAQCGLISIQDRAQEGKTYLCTINSTDRWVSFDKVATVRKQITLTGSDRGGGIGSDRGGGIGSDRGGGIGSDRGGVSDLIPEGINIKESILRNQSNSPLTPQGEMRKEEIELDSNPETSTPDILLPDQLKPTDSAGTNSTPGGKSSATVRENDSQSWWQVQSDNSAFVGHGNTAPDGKQRPFDQRRAVWKSLGSDPWMKSGSNPNKDFKQWRYQQYQREGKSLGLADAASEIRNDYARAADLWEEYQGELHRRQEVERQRSQQHQAVEPTQPTTLPEQVETPPQVFLDLKETLLKKQAEVHAQLAKRQRRNS